MSRENVCTCGHHIREHKDDFPTNEALFTSASSQKICSFTDRLGIKCSCTSFHSIPVKIETSEPKKPVLLEKEDHRQLLKTLGITESDYDNVEIIQLVVDGHGENYEI